MYPNGVQEFQIAPAFLPAGFSAATLGTNSFMPQPGLGSGAGPGSGTGFPARLPSLAPSSFGSGLGSGSSSLGPGSGGYYYSGSSVSPIASGSFSMPGLYGSRGPGSLLSPQGTNPATR